MALFRADGDLDGELATIALLGLAGDRLVATRIDILGELFPRLLGELEAEGHPLARALASIGHAVVADLDGDGATVSRCWRASSRGRSIRGGPPWPTGSASTLAGSGRASEALAVLDRDAAPDRSRLPQRRPTGPG